MIISFEYKAHAKSAEELDNFEIFNVKEDNIRNNLMFPQEGMDIEYISGNLSYKVYFDTEVKLDENHSSTKIINIVNELHIS
jgi:hypothetical protein